MNRPDSPDKHAGQESEVAGNAPSDAGVALAAPGSDSSRLARVLLGVTGSVGASFVPNGLLWLRQHSQIETIDIIVSSAAASLVSAGALRALSRGRVVVDSNEDRHECEPLHVMLTMEAELFLIMPATANILGKAAQGIADDLISSSIIAARCPVAFAPCMKSDMWQKAVVQRNVEILRRDGYHVVDPVMGYSVASGQMEIGAMPRMEDIFPALLEIVRSHGAQCAY